MADKLNIGIERARQWKASALLGASIIGGCLVIAAPAFAKVIDVPAQPGNTPPPIQQPVYTNTNAEQMKAMQQKLETIQNELNQMTTGLVSQSSSSAGMPLHGFMDVGYRQNSAGKNVTNPLVDNPKGFYQGTLSFYMAPHFGDRVKALAEPNFEVDSLNGSVAVDIERLQIGYAFSDAATLWGGRFHTPYGYWNTAFHHGAQLQTSVLRPRFLDFEDAGGILPAHMVGLWGNGKVRTGHGKFTYDWYAGNGPKISGANDPTITPYQSGALDPNIAGDDNHSAMVGFNLGYEFSGMLDGLRLAVHMLNGDVNAYDTTDALVSTTNLNTSGGSLVYLTNDWEIIGEYYGFNNKSKFGTGNGNKYKSKAGYVQVGVNFDVLTPYIRLERTVLDQNDSYFSMQATGQSYARQLLGLRYNLSQKACLKLELGNSSFKDEPGRTALSYRSLNLQYAIGF